MSTTPAQRLAEAEAALHELLLGKRAVKLMVDGQSVEFTAAIVDKLQAYVSQLKAEISCRPAYRAIPVVF
jgi:hypothetical protein